MFELLFDKVIYNNPWVYSLILMFIIASFATSMFLLIFKTYQMVKSNYYTFLFEKDLWNQSVEKNVENARKWESLSVLAKMFSEGFITFLSQYKKNDDYNSGSVINMTKSTMNIILLKDQEGLNQGLNILAFNAIFIPYASLTLALHDIINVFMTVEIGILSLDMFVKPLGVILMGMTLTGVSTVCYFAYQNRLEFEKEKFALFIEEFGTFLHKNFYTGDKK